jgi:hypothetical protein
MEKRQILKNAFVLALAVAALPLVGCHRSKQYEAQVEVTRLTAIRKDEQGNPLTADLEISYVECPGTQIEVLRGGKDFASCIAQKMKVGDKVKVKLEHHWDSEGHYDYDVYEVQGCPRPPDPNDEASYKMVRECNDWNVNGTRVGFQCNYQDKKDLNKKCPWFMKR